MIKLPFAGKKIGVVGLGVNNASVVEFFKKNKIDFEVVPTWENLEELSAKLLPFDVIFRTPGLAYNSLPIQEAIARGSTIYSQTKLFFDLCPATIIGVTGTKGKGTVTNLIANILKLASKKVFLGGNIGVDPFEFLEQLDEKSFVILELSSFQLQDLHKSPHIVVFTNLYQDHLNHHKDMKEYLLAKSNILVHQTPDDFVVLNKSLPKEIQNLGLGKKVLFDKNKAKDYQTKLMGVHNMENISAAVVVANLLSIEDSITRKAIATFSPLPHRLNIVRILDEVTYIDDSFSTNADSVAAAIEASPGNIVLIIGGFDKGVDFKALGKKIASSKKIKALVIIGQVTEKITAAVNGFRGQMTTAGGDMNEILQQARTLAWSNDTILFSPGTSSFDMFKNETDRGEQFVKAVLALE